jgi:hypothetical protein
LGFTPITAWDPAKQCIAARSIMEPRVFFDPSRQCCSLVKPYCDCNLKQLGRHSCRQSVDFIAFGCNVRNVRSVRKVDPHWQTPRTSCFRHGSRGFESFWWHHGINMDGWIELTFGQVIVDSYIHCINDGFLDRRKPFRSHLSTVSVDFPQYDQNLLLYHGTNSVTTMVQYVSLRQGYRAGGFAGGSWFVQST